MGILKNIKHVSELFLFQFNQGGIIQTFSVILWLSIILFRFLHIPLVGYIRSMPWTYTLYGKNMKGRIVHVGTIKEVCIEHVYTIPTIKGGIVIDVGANVGIAATYFLNQGFEEVYCFEPDAKNYLILSKNLSSMNTVHLYNLAVSDINGMISFHQSRSGICGFVSAENTKGNNVYTIPVTTLDTALKGKNCSPALLKIDVEGAELSVLKGAKNILKKYHPVIVIELHNGITPKDVLKNLEHYKYTTAQETGTNTFIFT